jgi:hypothetical protein
MLNWVSKNKLNIRQELVELAQGTMVLAANIENYIGHEVCLCNTNPMQPTNHIVHEYQLPTVQYPHANQKWPPSYIFNVNCFVFLV